MIFALKGKLFLSVVAAFQLSSSDPSSPNISSDVQRRRDQGQGSLTPTMTMSPAWGSAGDRAAAGQPGHQSAIGLWSPVNSASVSSLSICVNSFSHFTESLLTHKSPLTLFSSPTRVITATSCNSALLCFLWKKTQPAFLLN